jgi:hypothetical protein
VWCASQKLVGVQYALLCRVLQAQVLPLGECAWPPQPQAADKQARPTRRRDCCKRCDQVHTSCFDFSWVRRHLPSAWAPTDLHDSYQVRFNVLQAAVYGSPQNRRRVIIWGARRGVPLPEFPIPTHHFGTQWSVGLDTGLRLEPVTRDPERPHRGAPFRAVTVDDAISDLVSSFSNSARSGARASNGLSRCAAEI